MALTVKDLCHPFLGPVSLTLDKGDCLAIMGPSGAGKSLLLRAIADLDPCDGSILLDNRDWRGMTGPAWRRLIAYLPAEPGWWEDTVGDHFPDREKAADMAEHLLLPREIMDWTIARLSTGERQRLALIRSLLNKPSVLLLDEPTAALDRTARDAVEDLLQDQMAIGTSILLVTHDPEQADRLARCCLRMAKGRLQGDEEKADG